MFGALKFRDEFSYQYAGLPPNSYSASAWSGSAIPLATGGKLKFDLQVGSGSAAATVNLVIYGASASNGTFSSFTSLATMSVSAVSNTVAVLELRGEAVTNLGSGITWVKPVMNVVGSVQAAVLAKAFMTFNQPASGNDTTSYVSQEVDFF